jgi:hypothetical protein
MTDNPTLTDATRRMLDDVLKRDAPPEPPEKLYFKREMVDGKL